MLKFNKDGHGITISVTAETNAGGRRHMEDYVAVNLAPSEASFNEIGYLREQAFIGVFDGHGGKKAAKWARERLWEVIQKQPKFKSPDLKCVRESVIEGFMALHKEMEPLRCELEYNISCNEAISHLWLYDSLHSHSLHIVGRGPTLDAHVWIWSGTTYCNVRFCSTGT